jgi:hypothetical protein
MATYEKIIQTGYLLNKFNENETLYDLSLTGVIARGELAATADGGKFVNVPSWNHVAAFARADISQTTDDTFTHVSTVDDKAVVLTDVSETKYFAHDVIQTNEDIGNKLAPSFGEELADLALTRICNVGHYALGAMTSTAHTLDTSGAKITRAYLLQSKYKMGDKSGKLHTLLLHSAVWYDLANSLTSGSPIDTVAGSLVNNDRMNAVIGLRNIILCDKAKTANLTTGSEGDNRASSLLLGDGAFQMDFQRNFRVELDENIKTPSTTILMKGTVDWICHLRYLKFTGAANPSDGTLYNSSSYGVAYADHRDVRAALLVTGCSNI